VERSAPRSPASRPSLLRVIARWERSKHPWISFAGTNRAAILTNLPPVPEQEVLEQGLGSGRVNKGRSRRSDAGRSTTGLDLDCERPWWASHQHFGVNGRDKSSRACVGSMILRRQAQQACRGVHVPSNQPQINPASECREVVTGD
jgi:hypothetical protein